MSQERFFKGDIVQVVNTEYNVEIRVNIEAGTIGEVVSELCHSHYSALIPVRTVGLQHPFLSALRLRSDNLRIIKPNVEERERVRMELEKRKTLLQSHNVEIGSELWCRDRLLNRRPCRVVVTKVRDTSFDGYRLKKNGERCSGTRGKEALFFPEQIVDSNF